MPSTSNEPAPQRDRRISAMDLYLGILRKPGLAWSLRLRCARPRVRGRSGGASGMRRLSPIGGRRPRSPGTHAVGVGGGRGLLFLLQARTGQVAEAGISGRKRAQLVGVGPDQPRPERCEIHLCVPAQK